MQPFVIVAIGVVLAVAPVTIAQTTAAPPASAPMPGLPTLADFDKACASFNTSFTCARAIGAICLWDEGAKACTFRSKSCPNDLRDAMLATANCGATTATPCPPPCMSAQKTFVAIVHQRAGLRSYVDDQKLLTMAATNATVAQLIADVQYCTTAMTPAQYASMLKEGCEPTTDEYNAAIAALYAGSPAPGTSASGGTVPPKSAAVAIGTVVNAIVIGVLMVVIIGLNH